uniref:Cytochrome P450 n=1 Tax=Schizophyllum commune (strain H4-8 / FGSC 9210) TaxID=578458 RepID=D8Q919_SCHCM
MIINALLAVVVLSLIRVAWELLRRFIFSSPLDNIPAPPSPSFFTGACVLVVRFRPRANAIAPYFPDGSVIRLRGLLGERQLYVSDPKALHNIVVKDQHIFEEHPQFLCSNSIIFGQGLLTTIGDHHKKQRKLMNPVFSTAHMRNMIPLFQDVVSALRATLEKQTEKGAKEIDMLHWTSRTALELIGRTGLGYSFDTPAADAVAHPYAATLKELVPAVFRMFLFRVYVIPKVYNIGPAWFRRAVVNMIPLRDVRIIRDGIDLMWRTSNEIYAQKKAALAAGDDAVAKQVGNERDILSLLMRANMKAEDPLDEYELLSQMSTLIFAAMDTTSSALVRIMQLLAEHPEVQERLRDEIRAVKKEHPTLTYDDPEAMQYLDAVCRETLRMFVATPFPPMTGEDVVMPLGTPVTGLDGRSLSEVFVPKGTPIIISVINTNRSTRIWGADAKEWKPERWLAPLPEAVADAHVPGIYSNLMTFLGGGRSCIGFKFSQLEMKVVLTELVDAFQFSPSKQSVQWRMSNIVSAYVESEPEKTQLPIMVSRAP